ncbi:MAG: PaaI family thioesterase [Gemmatimonas sp.]
MREKTVSWADPVAGAQHLRTLSGMDALAALKNGDVPPPPIINLFGFEFDSLEPGKVVFSLQPDESHFNLLGMVHGGTMATMLDSAMGCAVHTMLPKGRGYTTLNISINYVRPIGLSTGRVFAEGIVVHTGRSTALATGKVVDANGKLLATGETTCMLFDV